MRSDFSRIFFLLTFVDLASAGKIFTAADVDSRSNRRSRNVDDNVLRPLRLQITSKISSRFANTLVTSVIQNSSPEKSREAKFVVQLPETAFISNFSMVVDGKLYIGAVKEKNTAREEYEEAKNKKLSTGLVSQSSGVGVRGMALFEIAFSVAPNSRAEFHLNYQQLLERKRGYFEQVISVRPEKVVPVLKLVIDIEEAQTLSYVDVMKIRKDPTDPLETGNPLAVMRKASPKSAYIEYSPSEDEQRKLGDRGVYGDFIFRYDVHHGNDAGVIQVLGSYFVQYFSPSGLSSLPKNVVFVIDISGSMSGEKINQTRQAMHAILSQLRTGDSFNIVLFNGVVTQWKSNAAVVTVNNIQAAKTFVTDRVHAGGSTNINDALLTALDLLRNTAGKVPLVLFLTDGEPTAGETVLSKIRSNIFNANEMKVSIFALGFGFSLDFDFLKAVSAENGGNARRIYPGKDAAGQLEGLFDEISTPLLLGIRFEYPKDVVNDASTTALSFGRYYEGSELVVSGKLTEGVTSRMMSVNIRGDNGSSPVSYTLSGSLLNLTVPPDKVIIEDFTERLWAYMKIKELIVQLLVSKDKQEQVRLKAEAIRLSLKYNFVTPLTSLVVVQSDVYLRSGRERSGDASSSVVQSDVYLRSGRLSSGDASSPTGLRFLFSLFFCALFCVS